MKNLFSLSIQILFILAFAIFPVYAQEGPDEIEPNDFMEEADEIIDMTAYAEIGFDDDFEDWFVVYGLESGLYSFTVDFDDELVEVDWEIICNDKVVASSDEYGAPEVLQANVSGDVYIHAWRWSGDGFYSIEIHNMNDNPCQGVDEVEPNDDIESVDYIEKFTISGYSCDGDHDWFMIENLEGETPTFILTFDDETVEVDWEIMSGDTPITSSVSYGSDDRISGEIDDTCYIHVWNWSGEGTYTIQIKL